MGVEVYVWRSSNLTLPYHRVMTQRDIFLSSLKYLQLVDATQRAIKGLNRWEVGQWRRSEDVGVRVGVRDECGGGRDEGQVFPFFNESPFNRTVEHLGSMFF